ncbi:MAG: SIS domain-containing protein [Chloroflexi bacterium]|nr:SIS domain-containing protein [Chloroflexota bacterium]
MSASYYMQGIGQIIEKVLNTQGDKIRAAALACADSIAAGRAVHAFGSGHSVIPVMDLFPRYGSYVGWHPIMDPRLMWFNVTGPGGARELLWLERTEGYVKQVMLSYNLDARDSFLIYSHGGLNAAPVEMALLAKEKGLTVIAVSSLANRAINQPTHSSGKALQDVADIVIDNCCAPEDALVPVEGRPEHVGGTSTIIAMIVTQALMAETTGELVKRGCGPERIFVSPNVAGVPADNNMQVFRDYQAWINTL